jgi:hypothetical protein
MFASLLIGMLALAPQQTDTIVSVRPNARLELENFGVPVPRWCVSKPKADREFRARSISRSMCRPQ